MINRSLLFLFIAFLFTIKVQAQKTYTLLFNPSDGDSYGVSTKIKSNMVQNIFGQEVKIDMDYTIDMTYNIASDVGANKKINMRYDKIKMDMQVMGQHVSMDSESPDTTNAANTIFRSLKGKSVSVTMDANGNLISTEGDEAILNNALADEVTAQTLKGVLGEDAIKSLFQQAFGFYPITPVKVGDTWASKTTIKSPFEINAANNYTLTKIERDTAYINVASTLYNKERATFNYNGVEMNLDLKGDITGVMKVNLRTGITYNSHSSQHITGNIEAQGQKIPMALNTDVDIDFTKLVKGNKK